MIELLRLLLGFGLLAAVFFVVVLIIASQLVVGRGSYASRSSVVTSEFDGQLAGMVRDE
jgi:Na+-translocating ferredoxin:NAD+ oxidoreductase RnfE subunit